MRFNKMQARWVLMVALVGILAFSSASQVDRERSYMIPFFPAASDTWQEGFARVINHSPEAGEVRIVAYDDSGSSYGPIILSINAHETVHFNSEDLEYVSAANTLSHGVGSGRGDWRLELSSELDVEVLSYIISSDGFLTAMHDTAPSEGAGHRIAIFNPASDTSQSSLLRLVNYSGESAEVAITGIDDTGLSPGTGLTISIAPGSSRTLTSFELESGNAQGLTGLLGDGVGKWQLLIESTQPIVAMSLLSSPSGHLTNLSTAPLKVNDRTHTVPLFPTASDSYERQGLVRVVNRSDVSGTATIAANDDTDRVYSPLILAIGAKETVHFNSDDLEIGNASKGLSGSTGSGQGDWWLELSSGLDIEVLSYIRTADGFLTAMHDTVPHDGVQYRVAMFNSGSESNQTSLLRMINPGNEIATATITGTDDQGASQGTGLTIPIAPGSSRTLTSIELETGAAQGLSGLLGDGAGKWQLAVNSDKEIIVMSLLSTPTGHLTNLSTVPAQHGDASQPHPNLEVSDISVTTSSDGIYPGGSITLSATVLNAGDDSAAATTLRYYLSTNATISTLDTEVGTDAVEALEASGSSAKVGALTVPQVAGTYYYGACVDTVPREYETTDNCSVSVTVEVEELAQHPDLEVASPSLSSSTLAAGAEFTLMATVRNAGDGQSAATMLRYYHSTNGTITSLDTEVGTDSVGALSASGSSAEVVVLTAPQDAGDYYYGACVDAVPGESETTDNCSVSMKLTVEESAQHPNLEVDSPTLGNVTPAAGAEFTLSATVRNTGDGSATPTTLRYYLSTNAAISTLDTEVETHAVEALAASGSSTEIVVLTAPQVAGTYYYGACVDTVSGESETTDNCSTSVTVEVAEPAEQPDLELGSPTVSDGTPAAGGEFSLSVTVSNTGEGNAVATTLRYYHSTNASISALDTEVGTDAVGSLSASVSSEELVMLSAPLDAGIYFYGACVDIVPRESDTTDNCSVAVKVEVDEPAEHPDLEVGSPVVSNSTSAAGAEFTMSVTVLNTGDRSAAATTLRYYRSTNASMSTLDTEVGTDAVEALSASGSSAELVTLTAPLEAGTYYYGACVDSVSGESETTDNCSTSVSVEVEESAHNPDLEVGTPTVSDGSPVVGKEFNMSVTVLNAGDENAAATTIRYYRSTNETISTLDIEVGTDTVEALVANGSSAELVVLTAPLVGSYYYGACVDAVPGEMETTDNCSTPVAVEVEASEQHPDLELGTPTVSDGTPIAGMEFALSATVSNVGDESSVATTLRYYRSTNTTISSFDTEVELATVEALAASGSSAMLVVLPAPSDSGTYYFGACVDAVSGESNTRDNCSVAVTVEVEASEQHPDLEVGTPSLSNSTPAAGSDFTLSTTVLNTGSRQSEATTLRYYLSTDAAISTSDTVVGTDAVGILAASSSSAELVALTAPLAAGSYYYGACVDAVSSESDTTDNCSTSVAVEVEEPVQHPDLEVGTPTLSNSTLAAGAEFMLSATVSNVGDGQSMATTLFYFRSTDATISTSDTQVGTDSVEPLAASGSSAELVALTAPLDAGSYYYGACVDTVLSESDTTDNCSTSVAVEVEESAAAPDLTISTISSSASTDGVNPGSAFTLSGTVANEGDGPSDATTLRYYRSTDATISTSDTQVGTDSVGVLPASGNSDETISLTAPSAAGTYYYGACVNTVPRESDITDNCSVSVQVDVTELVQHPDLTVASVSVNNNNLAAGAEFTLSATVNNGGDGDASATTLRYYRSTSMTISILDTQVGRDAVEALAGSGSSSESVSLTAPSSSGTYYYGACVDAVSGESDTSNNCSSSVTVTVTETQGSPDFTVGTPSVNNNNPATGAQFTLSATVRNAGDGDAAATTLRYYRSKDSTISTSDTEEGADAVGALFASGSSAESVSLNAPSTAGIYYYGACVDTVTGESNTTNNCSSSVQVDVRGQERQGQPDLVVGTPTVTDSSPATGSSFTLSATVTNSGGAESPATTLHYYRSTNATITSTDTAEGTDAVGALTASGTSAESIPVTAPSTAGTYYYGACVDTVTDESNTANNCSTSVQVAVREQEQQVYPDLEVGTPSVSNSSPATGSSFTLSATVTNSGEVGSPATTLRYYRSTDATISSSDMAEGTDSVGALTASGTSAESIPVTAPSTAGTYYYGACVDSVTGESNTTNNCSVSVHVEVEEPDPVSSPDLIVLGPSVSDSPAPGGTFRLLVTVHNQGDLQSAETMLQYYRSTDATITTSDTSVGTDTVGSLSHLQNSGESISLTAPPTAGTYYYGACVDAVTGESNTTNNCSVSVEVVHSEPPEESGPDLSVYAIKATHNSEVYPGDYINLSLGVRNGGDQAAAATTMRFYRSTDLTITTSDTEEGSVAVAELDASASKNGVRLNVTAPSTAGTYYYGACVDSVTDESDVTNNCSASVTVDVVQPPYPELVVGTPTVSDSSPETGSSFTVSATVSNTGGAESPATTLRYYRSTDATITSSDTSEGTDAVGALTASGTSAESITVTAPSTAGTYYYGACVDSVTDEIDTDNNCSGSVAVMVSEPP